MTRVVSHSNFSTPASRARLRPRAKPFWQALDCGVHLGAGAVGGHWVVRQYLGGQKYSIRTFAIADDHRTADGAEVMSYAQARRHALEPAAAPPIGPLDVKGAMQNYFARLEQKGKKKAT
jgi:hypothetical protein